MRFFITISFALTLLSLALAFSSELDYVFEEGPYQTFSKRLDKDDYEGLDYNLYVYGPDAPGDFPVIYFSSSLAGIAYALPERVFLGAI